MTNDLPPLADPAGLRVGTLVGMCLTLGMFALVVGVVKWLL